MGWQHVRATQPGHPASKPTLAMAIDGVYNARSGCA